MFKLSLFQANLLKTRWQLRGGFQISQTVACSIVPTILKVAIQKNTYDRSPIVPLEYLIINTLKCSST